MKSIVSEALKNVNDTKANLIDHIREAIAPEGYHEFKTRVYIHFIEGEVATTELCVGLEYVESEERFFFISKSTQCNVEVSSSRRETELMGYDVGSLVDIYTTLIGEVREKLIDEIEDIVKKNGRINFESDEDEKKVYVTDGSDVCLCTIKSIRLDSYDNFVVDNTFLGDDFEDYSDAFDTDELRKILKYVKEETQETFHLTASVVLSRPFEVKADTWEEATEKVKEMLKKEPLDEKDSNGIEIY